MSYVHEKRQDRYLRHCIYACVATPIPVKITVKITLVSHLRLLKIR